MSPLPVLTSPLLDLPGVRHAFFTRQGGVSEGIYESLNVGVGSRDDAGAVSENRRRAAAHFGLPVERLVTNYQVHSAVVSLVVSLDDVGLPRAEADGLVTDLPGVICGALAADCAPVLMFEPEKRVIAAVHAGWKGALAGVTDRALAAMVQDFHADISKVIAVVGPCIGPASYEVGLEFEAAFTAEDPGHARFFVAGAAPEKRMFDLPAFVLGRLAAAGVARAEWIGRDTCAEPALFYSNRRAFRQGEGDYGRLLSAIVLA